MKPFFKSKRFVIPFVVIFITHLVYLTWDMWNLYADDFNVRGIPAGVKWRWIYLNSLFFMALVFAIALLIGITNNMHFYAKRIPEAFKPFSRLNLFAITLIAFGVFLYVSFIEPPTRNETRIMAATIIYTKPGALYKPSSDDELRSFPPSVNSMTLAELFDAKDSLSRIKPGNDLKLIDPVRFEYSSGEIKRIHRLIAEKLTFPLIILSFFGIGTLIGFLLRKLPGIIPILFSYSIVFTCWYYGKEQLRIAYHKDNIGTFTGLYALPLAMLLTAVIGGILIEKKRAAEK